MTVTAGPTPIRRLPVAPPRPERYPIVGAAALDMMAAIAGPPWTPDHRRAWSTAFEIVVRAMPGGTTAADLAVAA